MVAELPVCYHPSVHSDSAWLPALISWLASILELGLLFMVLYRGIPRRLPIFSAYVFLIVLKEAMGFWVLYRYGLHSRPYYYLFWVSQGIFVVLRGLVVGELLHTVLQPFRGVWAFARLALSVSAVTLLLYALMVTAASAAQISGFILLAERGLEFAVVGTLLALLAICRYYEVKLDPFSAAIALGLAIYSAVAIMNNTALFKYVSSYVQAWGLMRQISFGVAVAIWLWPLLWPAPAPEAAPAIAAPGVYQELVPEFSGRMRALNDRLIDLLQR